MSRSDETSTFLDRLNSGEDAALEQLFVDYSDRLLGLVRRRMGSHIPSDPESVVASVFGSMIRGIREERFRLDERRKTWNLLVTISLNKIRKRWNKKRPALQDAPWEVVLQEGPSAEDLVEIEDVVRKVLDGLESPYPEILWLRMEGHTKLEIADALGMTHVSVKTRLNRLRERLERILSRSV